MRSSQFEQAEALLDASEKALRVLLIANLPSAIAGNSLFFFNSEFCPPESLANQLAEVNEEIYLLAKKCVHLRIELAQPVEKSVGDLFLSACVESASDNPQRRGPRKLAAFLLKELSAI
jgi:hypothetical protein